MCSRVLASTSSERSRQEKKRPSRPLPGLLRWGRGRRMSRPPSRPLRPCSRACCSACLAMAAGSGAALTVDAAGRAARSGRAGRFCRPCSWTSNSGPTRSSTARRGRSIPDPALRDRPRHGADLVDGELARQDDAAGAQVLGGLQALRVRDVGQGGEVDLALETGLPRQIQHGQILHDDAVGAHLPGQTMDETVGRPAVSCGLTSTFMAT